MLTPNRPETFGVQSSNIMIPNLSGVQEAAQKANSTKPLVLTADNSTADTAYVPMVLYNTDAVPPAASGFPIGTLYVQYTA